MTFKAKKIKEASKMKKTMKELSDKVKPSFSSTPTKLFGRYVTVGVGILFVLFIIMQGYSFIRNFRFDFSITQVVDTIFGADLKTDNFGRTNMLLLGTSGGGHDGSDLTDSIMVASYDHQKNTVTLFSIPRDFYVEVTKGRRDRINTVYGYYQRNFDTETAVEQMRTLLENITGLTIQYYAEIDFRGFVEVVDILGGIEVDVPERLVDTLYPIEDQNGRFLRHETFVVEEGVQTMDGETALKYARSRQSTSDFARSERQQLILAAIKEKALKEKYLTNPNSLKRIYYAINDNFETDITINEMIRGGRLAKDLDTNRIVSAGLNDDRTKLGGFLYAPSREFTNGAAVLVPEGSTVSDLDNYVIVRRFVDLLTTQQEIFLEKANIHISNGSRVIGLAGDLRDELTRYGFNVVSVGNTENREIFETSKIYVNAAEGFDDTIDSLRSFVIGDIAYRQPLSEGSDTSEEEYDIEIIIGKDYDTYLN